MVPTSFFKTLVVRLNEYLFSKKFEEPKVPGFTFETDPIPLL